MLIDLATRDADGRFTSIEEITLALAP